MNINNDNSNNIKVKRRESFNLAQASLMNDATNIAVGGVVFDRVSITTRLGILFAGKDGSNDAVVNRSMRRIFGELTVEENLRLGLAGRRTQSGAAEAIGRAYELFPVVGEFRRRAAGALSGGQQQQLAIARALVAEPDVLLLDEPSLGLAPRIVDVVFEALAAIRESGLAVLLVEQRAQRTVALADRCHVISNGELRLTLGRDDAGDTEKLVAAYFS